MQTSHKIALVFIVFCIGIVLLRIVAHDTSHEQRVAQVASGGAVFPGVGSQSDWLAARAIAHESANAIRAQQYDRALELGQQAIAKYPNDPDFYNNTGYGLLLRNQPGDAAQAEPLIRQAIQLRKDDPRYWDNLGRAFAGQNKIQEAREAFVQAANLNPNPDQAAEINQNIKLLDEAAAGAGAPSQ